MPFSNQAIPEEATGDSQRAVPYELKDYPELVDWSGRAIGRRQARQDPGRAPVDPGTPEDRSRQLRPIHQPHPEKFLPRIHRQRQVDASPRRELRKIISEGTSRSRGAFQSGLAAGNSKKCGHARTARFAVSEIRRIRHRPVNSISKSGIRLAPACTAFGLTKNSGFLSGYGCLRYSLVIPS